MFCLFVNALYERNVTETNSLLNWTFIYLQLLYMANCNVLSIC